MPSAFCIFFLVCGYRKQYFETGRRRFQNPGLHVGFFTFVSL